MVMSCHRERMISTKLRSRTSNFELQLPASMVLRSDRYTVTNSNNIFFLFLSFFLSFSSFSLYVLNLSIMSTLIYIVNGSLFEGKLSQMMSALEALYTLQDNSLFKE